MVRDYTPSGASAEVDAQGDSKRLLRLHLYLKSSGDIFSRISDPFVARDAGEVLVRHRIFAGVAGAS